MKGSTGRLRPEPRTERYREPKWSRRNLAEPGYKKQDWENSGGAGQKDWTTGRGACFKTVAWFILTFRPFGSPSCWNCPVHSPKKTIMSKNHSPIYPGSFGKVPPIPWDFGNLTKKKRGSLESCSQNLLAFFMFLTWAFRFLLFRYNPL